MANTTTINTYKFLSDYDNAKRIIGEWLKESVGVREFEFTVADSTVAKHSRSTQFQLVCKLPNGDESCSTIEIIYSYDDFNDEEKVEFGIRYNTNNPRYGVVTYNDILNYTDGEFGDVDIIHPFIATLRNDIIFAVDNKTVNKSDDEAKSDDSDMFAKFKAALNGELGVGFGFGVCENIEELEQVLSAIRERFGDIPINFGIGFGR